jgi:hypothetical protein
MNLKVLTILCLLNMRLPQRSNYFRFAPEQQPPGKLHAIPENNRGVDGTQEKPNLSQPGQVAPVGQHKGQGGRGGYKAKQRRQRSTSCWGIPYMVPAKRTNSRAVSRR